MAAADPTLRGAPPSKGRRSTRPRHDTKTHNGTNIDNDKEEQERQGVNGGKDMEVDGGEDTQAREELEEGRQGTNGPTREEGGGDEQGTGDRGGGGGGNGGM